MDCDTYCYDEPPARNLTIQILTRAALEIAKQKEDDPSTPLIITPKLERELVALLQQVKRKYYEGLSQPDMFSRKVPGDFEPWGFWHNACNLIIGQLTRGHRANHMKQYANFPDIAERKVWLPMYDPEFKQLMALAQKHFS